MNVQKARSPSASRRSPWPLPAAARPGLMAPRSKVAALRQGDIWPCKPRRRAGAPCTVARWAGSGARLVGYLCTRGGKAMFVAAADRDKLECTLYSGADHQLVHGRTQISVGGAECGREQLDVVCDAVYQMVSSSGRGGDTMYRVVSLYQCIAMYLNVSDTERCIAS